MSDDRRNENRNTYGATIEKHRAAMKITKSELARRLGVHRNFVTNWEMGISRPDISIIPAICRELQMTFEEFFGLPIPMASHAPKSSKEDKQLLDLYDAMDSRNKAVFVRTAQMLLDIQQENLTDYCRKYFQKVVVNSHYAAAGTFNPLSDDNDFDTEYIRVKDGEVVPDEIVIVSGDSMEPTFYAGDKLLVQHTETLRAGEIGIIVVNGEGYVKEFYPDGMRSHNPKVKYRKFEADDDVRIFGRVLGKVTNDMYPDRYEQLTLEEMGE